MNERFLYRGKHIIDDKWIIGNVVEFAGLTQIWVDCNTHSKSFIVNPHTIGQCTGSRTNSSATAISDLFNHFYRFCIFHGVFVFP